VANRSSTGNVPEGATTLIVNGVPEQVDPTAGLARAPPRVSANAPAATSTAATTPNSRYRPGPRRDQGDLPDEWERTMLCVLLTGIAVLLPEPRQVDEYIA
jgi:hypothetical protein